MKITAQVGMWMCAAFALFCTAFAFNGFANLGTLSDDAERELSLGYSWFWVFLGAVGVVFGILSWMIKEGKFGNSEQQE